MSSRIYTAALVLGLQLALHADPGAYQKAGLNSYQAAAHLLSRFSYGATPGQVEAVVAQGLDRWLEVQLKSSGPGAACEQRLNAYPSLKMDPTKLRESYVSPQRARKLAEDAGILDPKEELDKAEKRREVNQFIRQAGYLTERELLQELLAQKVTRAVYADNQLQEVLTDFWFNHFNVSKTNGAVRVHLLSYERDAVRPHASGRFRTLLGATAKHPAMLYYLNNAQSVADADAPHLRDRPGTRARRLSGKRPVGLNENYARELMELHTLGVDGGYSQKDVTEVARILTGWTAMPRNGGGQIARLLERDPKAVYGDGNGFYFVPYFHDSGAKNVMGSVFPAGRGMDEGERLLDMLALHPKTSQRIARKFAARFVADEPDPQLVQQLDRVFRRSGGDTSALVRALVNSPEFWSEKSRRAKVKSPLEFCVSGVRAMNGQLTADETAIPQWTEKMGQNLYGCVPPTGYPDRSEQWISSGTLVHRLNFAFQLSANKLRGVKIPPPDGSLDQQAKRMLPGRSLDQALAPARKTLANDALFKKMKAEGSSLNEAQKIAGVLLSCPEFQRR